MTEHSTRLDRNAGRPEFLAALKKMEALFEAGFDRKTVHGLLRDKGILTMSYPTFCRQLTRHKGQMATPKTLGFGVVAKSARTRLLKSTSREAGQPPSALKH